MLWTYMCAQDFCAATLACYVPRPRPMADKCQTASESCGAGGALFYEMKDGKLTATAHWNPDSRIAAMRAKRGDDKLWTTETYNFKFEPGQGAPGRAFQNNNPEFVADISALDVSAFPRKNLAEEFGVKSVCAVPCAGGVIEVFKADGWASVPNVECDPTPCGATEL